MTPRQFANWCERVATGLPVAAEESLSWGLGEALERAEDYSSGPYSTNELRRRPEPDHPYARRHGAPKYDPSEINVQSGDLVSEWASEGPVESEGDYLAFVYNRSPHAQFLYLKPGAEQDRADAARVIEEGGTQTMFGRPLPDRVVTEVEPELFTRYRKAVVALLRR